MIITRRLTALFALLLVSACMAGTSTVQDDQPCRHEETMKERKPTDGALNGLNRTPGEYIIQLAEPLESEYLEKLFAGHGYEVKTISRSQSTRNNYLVRFKRDPGTHTLKKLAEKDENIIHVQKNHQYHTQ